MQSLGPAHISWQLQQITDAPLRAEGGGQSHMVDDLSSTEGQGEINAEPCHVACVVLLHASWFWASLVLLSWLLDQLHLGPRTSDVPAAGIQGVPSNTWGISWGHSCRECCSNVSRSQDGFQLCSWDPVLTLELMVMVVNSLASWLERSQFKFWLCHPCLRDRGKDI